MSEEERKAEDDIAKIHYAMDDREEAYRAANEKRQIIWTMRGARDEDRDK